MTPTAAFAPAKVNLFLHVGPARADGFHPICSLMAFADVGDRLVAAPAERFSLALDGPFSAGLSAGEDNLAIRAARALFQETGMAEPALRLSLTKQLPAEAGLGGGSSDAAATLRLLRRALDLDVADARLQVLAAGLGSDVPACLVARPVLAGGRGERLSPVAASPSLPAVLVRPPVGSPTSAVYSAYDAGAPADADSPDMSAFTGDPGAVAAMLAACRNDLEAPAVALQPAIGEVLQALRSSPETLLARMSGSGSACFALCADPASARTLADRIAAAHPRWWTQACALGAPGLWPES